MTPNPTAGDPGTPPAPPPAPDKAPPAKTPDPAQAGERTTVRVPRVKAGEVVSVTFPQAPGPQPVTEKATVKKAHPDGTLDLEVAKGHRRAKPVHLERVPFGTRPIHMGAFWLEYLEPEEGDEFDDEEEAPARGRRGGK